MLSSNDSSCFAGSYQQARQRLEQAVAQLPAGLMQEHRAFQHPLPGPDGQALYMDCYSLGQSQRPENVLVLISATHGVEGFAGSAIQSYHMRNLSEQLQQHANLGVLVIHALNPWGFAWQRRYDHEGIDLNRNFIDFQLPLPDNEMYALMHHDCFDDRSQDITAVFADWRKQWGDDTFEAVVTRGQYQYSDGLFYGGQHASWSRQVLEGLAQDDFLQQPRHIAVIDLHTGLGPYGHGEVISDHEPDTVGFQHARDWYGAHVQSALLGESCSPPKTGLLDYFWHELVGARGCFVTLEYGTYPLNGLLQSLCEEQRYYNDTRRETALRDIDHQSVISLREFFYPRDRLWQELVLFRAGQVIQLAMQGLMK